MSFFYKAFIKAANGMAGHNLSVRLSEKGPRVPRLGRAEAGDELLQLMADKRQGTWKARASRIGTRKSRTAFACQHHQRKEERMVCIPSVVVTPT